MLAISEQDITSAVSVDELTDAMELAFRTYASGNFLMPDRMHVHSGENTLLLMPCFMGHSFSTKLVSVFPGNTTSNQPVIQGIVILNDGATGKPLALLNGPKLTAMRTAAVGSLGIRFLADGKADTLGIIGVGVQGVHQAVFACRQRPFRKLIVFARHSQSLDSFEQETGELFPDIELIKAKSVEELLEDSRVVIAATSSHLPVMPDDEGLLKGKCFIGIGSFKPDMREFPRALYGLVDKIYTDTEFASKESGDLVEPLKKAWITKNQVTSLSTLISGKVSLEPNPTKCFKSVGMALFDLVAADLIYKKAKEKNLGTIVNL